MIGVGPMSCSARRAAEWFRKQGYNPLPSDPSHRHPLYSYARLRDEGVPAERFGRWRFSQGFLQVATGARWGLAVVDLDGPTAQLVWDGQSRYRGGPPTWEVSTPSGGRHLWFS